MAHKKRLLTRARFEAWLRAFEPREIVGLRRVARSCPLARYLKDEAGYGYVFVDEYGYELREPMTAEAALRGRCNDTLPPWAERVIGGVDFGGHADEGVTAQEVRRILRERAH